MMFRILLVSLLVAACFKIRDVGTADRYGDRFADERDACADQAGVAPDGCPIRDGDGDGFADERDACVDRPGVAPDGCPIPDGDGDGIADKRDACPKKPGVAPYGCPDGDGDGDGVTDVRDACPDKPGVVWDGCPAPDMDGDGFADGWDGCEETPGVAPSGCPVGDADGDGVLDIDDNCPFEFGEETDGCSGGGSDCQGSCDPFDGALKGVRFKRATELASTARENIDDAAEAMNRHHSMRIELSGHADDREKDAEALSMRRAQAVFKHLVKRGVDRKRVRFRGAGMSEPIGDNETDEGRAKNRRVDITIIIR